RPLDEHHPERVDRRIRAFLDELPDDDGAYLVDPRPIAARVRHRLQRSRLANLPSPPTERGFADPEQGRYLNLCEVARIVGSDGTTTKIRRICPGPHGQYRSPSTIMRKFP